MRRLWPFARKTDAARDLAILQRALTRTRKGMRKHPPCTARGEALAYEEFLLLGQVRRARAAVENETNNEL